jgi:Tfp pilus assembly protein PilO
MNTKYSGPERRYPMNEGWHLDKRVPIATLVTLVVLAAGGVLHISEIRKDVELLREQNKAITDRMNRADATSASAISEVKQSILRMETKLDRLIERDPRNGRTVP